MEEELDFKMSQYDNEITDMEHLDIITEEMGIDCDEAERLLALGKILGLYLSDMQYDWKESKNDTQLYEHSGREYYIGTDEELEDIAKDLLKGSYDMVDLWKEAVANDSTMDGFERWRDSIIDSDGYTSILDRYNGCGMTVKVGDKWLTVCNFSGN